MSGFTNIHVVQVDIDKATKSHSSRCVIATAVKRSIPDAKRVEVDMQTIRWTDGEGQRVVFVTPASVMNYIIHFDAGDEIEPFTFRLYNDRQATIPALVRNKEAQKIDNAKAKLRYAKRQEAKMLADPDATAEVKTAATKKVAKATQAVKKVAKSAGPKAAATKKKQENDTHYRIPTHPKTGRRYYGAKVMRVNQPDAVEARAETEAAVES